MKLALNLLVLGVCLAHDTDLPLAADDLARSTHATDASLNLHKTPSRRNGH